MFLGAHMSIAGGMHLAIQRAQSVECESLQIFLKNSNQWRAKPLSEEEIFLYREARMQSDIKHVIAHSAYLINLCSPDPATAKLSFESMLYEMQRADALGVDAIVLHPGAHKGSGEICALGTISKAVNELLAQTAKSRVRLLFESTAGQGSCVGHTFEHLRQLLRSTKKKSRIGVCLDTCHLFAAGHDIRTESAYEQTMERFEQTVGFEYLHAVHLNDSKKPLGSRVDRHSHIGQGEIGLAGFANFLNDPRLLKIPGIIETPKGPDLVEDRMNLSVLRSLVKSPA